MLNLPTQLRPAAPGTVLPSIPATASPGLILAGDVVYNEHAIASLRRYLRDAGLGDWRIFHAPMPYLAGIDNVLERLDPQALWEAFDHSLAGAEGLTAVTFNDDDAPVAPGEARAWQGGVLHLRTMQCVVARWYWYNVADARTLAFHLVAAPQLECVRALRSTLTQLNRNEDEPYWQVVGDYGDGPRVPRGTPADHDRLVLEPTLRERVETEIVGFFDPKVRALYERLGVSYRRGVLMYGDPGNGKTSLIRMIGARLPKVAAILLRARHNFDTDTLSETFETWKQLAPAILVIEDLTAVLERVNLSTLLNLLDGVDQKLDNGLMLIASTNHPDKLDPALGNRPGRFDVVIELPAPSDEARRQFLRTRLIEVDLATIEKVVDGSGRMSFAHLEEILQMSGMIAVRAGRDFRVAADVTTALDHIRAAFNTACMGYAKLPEAPFGLVNWKK